MDTKSPIPTLYRFLFLYIEPAGALFGAVSNIFDPLRYLQSLSTHSSLAQPI